jgi:hypothetical protein
VGYEFLDEHCARVVISVLEPWLPALAASVDDQDAGALCEFLEERLERHYLEIWDIHDQCDEAAVSAFAASGRERLERLVSAGPEAIRQLLGDQRILREIWSELVPLHTRVYELVCEHLKHDRPFPPEIVKEAEAMYESARRIWDRAKAEEARLAPAEACAPWLPSMQKMLRPIAECRGDCAYIINQGKPGKSPKLSLRFTGVSRRRNPAPG